MTQVIRDNKTITELQQESDYEWQDGDDSALYDEGYDEGVNYAIRVIDNVLMQDSVDNVPSSWILKVIKHTLQQGE